MRKIYTLIVVILFSTLQAQNINIPDALFKSKLLAARATNFIAKDLSGNYFKIDTNNDGEIQESEALAVSYLDIQCSQTFCSDNMKMSNITGIEAFQNLIYLNCDSHNLTTLPINSLVQLQTLSCSKNLLQTLNLSGLSNLTNLSCFYNRLQSLNLSPCPNLKELTCGNFLMTSINLSPVSNLESLDISQSALTTLDVSNLSRLKILNFSHNNISSINLSALQNLENISFRGNQFTSVNLTALTNLKALNCSVNQLTAIDISANPNLSIIDCSSNQITNLDTSNCLEISTLIANNNQLQQITIASEILFYLNVSNNLLTTLDLTNKSKIESMMAENNNLQSLFIKGALFTDPDMGNMFSNYRYSGNPGLRYVCASESRIAQVNARNISYGYTNSEVNSYCSFNPDGVFYAVEGNLAFDSDNNGCNQNDHGIPFQKFKITVNGASGSLIADNTGHYYLPVSSGNHTIVPIIENPAYFNVNPTSLNVTFPAQVSPHIQDFCITPNGTHPDLEMVIIPTTDARPGFDITYKLVYKNKGNTTQSGTVNLNFDDAILDFMSANPTVASQSLNNLSWNFTNLRPFETREVTVVLNANSPMETPALNDGDVLNYTATIASAATDEMPEDNTFAFNHTVVNSFDPNDKTCLEGNSVTTEMSGKYVHYKIRFENTGTANAQNIVVKDIIDNDKFDVSSLVSIDGSHEFVTKISGNKAEFIFENINLPFDDANNDGYIVFKIRTKPNLTLGDSFSNTASIYFDYNFPIITNTETTNIELLATKDFEFSDYFALYPNPAGDILNVQSKKGIKISSVSIYNVLGQLVLVNTNFQHSKTIDVSALKSGNYFIKVNSDKGISNVRFVKK